MYLTSNIDLQDTTLEAWHSCHQGESVSLLDGCLPETCTCGLVDAAGATVDFEDIHVLSAITSVEFPIQFFNVVQNSETQARLEELACGLVFCTTKSTA